MLSKKGRCDLSSWGCVRGLDSTWDTWTVCLLLKMNWFIWQEMNLSKILCNCLVADLDDKYVHEVARPDTDDIIAGGAGGSLPHPAQSGN